MPKSTTKQKPSSQNEATGLLLDTHIAIWLCQTSPRLNQESLRLLEETFNRSELFVSTISAWEAGLLVANGRLDLGRAPFDWFQSFVQNFKVNVIDISAEIAVTSSFLPGKIHKDPADRILVATAISNQTALISADKELINYGKQGYVKIVAVA